MSDELVPITEKKQLRRPFKVKGDDNYEHIPEVNKRKLLVCYEETGNLERACRAAEIGRRQHYNWQKDDPDYAEAFQVAKAIAADKLEDEARRRAVEGVQEPVFYQGEIVGHKLVYSDLLLLNMLKAHKKEYRDKLQTEIIDHHSANFIADLRNMEPEKLAKLQELLGETDESSDT